MRAKSPFVTVLTPLCALVMTAAGCSDRNEFSLAGVDDPLRAVAKRGLQRPGSGKPVIEAPGLTTDLTVIPENTQLTVGQRLQLRATIGDSAGGDVTGGQVSWHSTDSSVVQIEPTGIAIARNVGSASVLVVAGKRAGSTPVTVVAPPSQVEPATIALTPAPVALKVGETFPLSGFSIKIPDLPLENGQYALTAPPAWSSSNPEVAVIADDKITAVNTGAATITLAVQSGSTRRQGAVSVTVEPGAPAPVPTPTPTPEPTPTAPTSPAADTVLALLPDGTEYATGSSVRLKLQLLVGGVVAAVGAGATFQSSDPQAFACPNGHYNDDMETSCAAVAAGSSTVTAKWGRFSVTRPVKVTGTATAPTTTTTTTTTTTATSAPTPTAPATSLPTVEPAPPAPSDPSYPNEPAGVTRLAEHTGDALLPNSNWAHWLPSGNLAVANGAIRFRYPAGTKAGTGPGDVLNVDLVPRPREVYIAFDWRVSENFVQNFSGQTKLFYVFQPPPGEWNPRNAIVPFIVGNPPYELAWWGDIVQNQQRQNRGPRMLYPGRWHRIEAVLRSASEPGRSDGVLRWWIDGVLVGEHTSVPFLANPWALWHGAPVWGGGPDPANLTGPTSVLQAEQHMYFDKIRISGR